jgi:hypothetical protein
VIRVQVRLDVGDGRSVKFDETVAKKVHSSHEPRHLSRQEFDEAIDGADVQACGELDPRVRMKYAAYQVHVYAVQSPAVPQERVVNFSASAQFFKVHR